MLIYDVLLDVGETGCQQTISLYQGDNRSKMLRITLLQNGKPYAVPSDLAVRLNGVKPTERTFSSVCSVRGGSVYYLPGASVTDTQGVVRCQLQILDHSDAILFSPEFSIAVASTVPVPELPEGAAEDAELIEEVLSALSASADGMTLLFRDVPVGIRTLSVLPQSAEEDTIVYLAGSGLYRYEDGTWHILTDDSLPSIVVALQLLAHNHTNRSSLDRFADTAGRLTYDEKTVPLIAPDDVTKLGFGTYNSLLLRDDAVDGESIQDVPVFVHGGVGDICGLYADADDPSECDCIVLSEVRQADTGMPLRILKVRRNGVYTAFFPQTFNAGLNGTVQAGWNRNNAPVDPPSLSGFSPAAFRVGSDWYEDVSEMPDDALSALRSLSQCVNVSAAAMGTLTVPDDAVERFSGSVEPNRKYSFTTDDNCTFSLPTVPRTEKDAQFALYLTCAADVDLTFPAAVQFAGGMPNSDAGSHKLIGCFLPEDGVWAVDGVDYAEVSA